MVIPPIISAAGGVGKTTLSLMLSYVLPPNYRVLLIDMDPTAGLTLRMLGDLTYQRLLSERRTLMDMIRDDEHGNVDIRNYIIYGRQVKSYDDEIKLYPQFNEVAVLSPGEGFDEFFAENQNMDVGKMVWKVLHRGGGIDGLFDVAIVDTAPFFDKRYTLIALYGVGRAVVVLRPTLTDTNRTNTMINKIAGLFRKMDERIPIFTLVFNFDPNKYVIEAKTLSDALKVQRIDIEENSGRPVSMSIAGRARKVDEMLRRNLETLVKLNDSIIDCFNYVLPPHNVRFGDESFPQDNHAIADRRISDDDRAMLQFTLSNLINRFGIKLNLDYDIVTE